MKLNNKIALVTGAGKRIGKAIAISLALEGVNIVVHYNSSKKEAEETVEEIVKIGCKAIAVRADLRKPDSIKELFDTIENVFGSLDILVNSASNFFRTKFDKITVKKWDEVMNTNLRAPFLLIQHASKLMKGNDMGSIVNISDLCGVHAWKNFSHHGTSKAGLIHLTKSAALELGPKIRVNGIIPGLILPPPYMKGNIKWEEMKQNNLLKTDGSPQDIANTVIFLCKNDFMTGSLIYVDGGENLLGSKYH